MFHSRSPSGKGNLFVTCNSFSTDYFCSHSFLKPLLNASSILETRDTAVSVLIQPPFRQRRNTESVINSSKSGSSRGPPAQCPFSQYNETHLVQKQSKVLIFWSENGEVGAHAVEYTVSRETMGGILLCGSCHLGEGGVLVAGGQGCATRLQMAVPGTGSVHSSLPRHCIGGCGTLHKVYPAEVSAQVFVTMNSDLKG